MRYSREYIDALLCRVEIVEVVRSFMSLERRGRSMEHVGLCPRHSEKTPSFVVHVGQQFYHCFGCGIHGKVINFLMDYQGMTYQQAVMWLAKRYRFYPKEWARRRRQARTTQARIQMKEALRM